MNKSIEFIKQRILQGQCAEWVPKDGWDSANIFNPYDVLGFDENERQNQIFTLSCNERKTNVKVIYDPNADFDYVSFEDCWYDGTLIFCEETRFKVASNPFGVKTINKSIIPNDFNCNSLESVFDYEYEYIIGDVIEMTEHKESPFADKPWLCSHTIVGMPIKMKFIKK